MASLEAVHTVKDVTVNYRKNETILFFVFKKFRTFLFYPKNQWLTKVKLNFKEALYIWAQKSL